MNISAPGQVWTYIWYSGQDILGTGVFGVYCTLGWGGGNWWAFVWALLSYV
jgi:hypothetical protein